jgi:chromosome segregation ATPase
MSSYVECGDCKRKFKDLYNHQRIRCQTVKNSIEGYKAENKMMRETIAELQQKVKRLQDNETNYVQFINDLQKQISELQQERKTTIINNNNNFIFIDENDIKNLCNKMFNYGNVCSLPSTDFNYVANHMNDNGRLDQNEIAYIHHINRGNGKRQKVAHIWAKQINDV